ncbi:BnaC08g40350D [Brassica napus]|uniref:BnaC08g40350D protein n=1 Tax=Brassica napus TaxID=3708 RepID=A0A078FUM9_BRANA|nr:BnaC08g40350D [Brassica napus]
MDESAKKGLELNGSDAEIRKSSIRRISVEGYDTSLRLEDVDEALRKYFASCGKIIHVSIPRNSDWTILCQFVASPFPSN